MSELSHTCPKCKIGRMKFKTKEETIKTQVIPKGGWYCDSCGHYQRVMLREQKWELIKGISRPLRILLGWDETLECPVCSGRFKNDNLQSSVTCPHCGFAIYLNQGFSETPMSVFEHYPDPQIVGRWLLMPKCAKCAKASVAFDNARGQHLCHDHLIEPLTPEEARKWSPIGSETLGGLKR